MKEYNFLYLLEATDPRQLGIFIGRLAGFARKMFGIKNLDKRLSNLAINKVGSGAWTSDVFGPKSQLMRELQTVSSSLKMLRDRGNTATLKAAEKEINSLIENSSRTVGETAESLASKIRAISEKLRTQATEASRNLESSRSVNSAIKSAEKEFSGLRQTAINNGKYFQDAVAKETGEIADRAMKGVSTKSSIASIQNSIRKLRARAHATTDAGELKILNSRIEALKTRLAKQQAAEQLSATAAFKPGNVNSAVDEAFATKLEPAARQFGLDRDYATGAREHLRGVEIGKAQSDPSIMNRIKNWWNGLFIK